MRHEPQCITKEFCTQATLRLSDARKTLDERQARLDADKDHRFRDFAQRDLDKTRKNFDKDPQRERRIAQQRCLPCFYIPRLAGAAMTSRECGLCGKDQMFSSTSTDVICVECAKAHSLCAHCAADIDGDTTRVEYPETEEGHQEA